MGGDDWREGGAALMEETPKSQEAFENYYAMGPERSLRKLGAQYEERQQPADKPPTVRLETLANWAN